MSQGVTRLPADGDAVTLSTGQTIDLPVSMDSTITAVVLPADRRAAADLLPDGLSPIRASRGTAAVWLLSATHRNVGGGVLDDYHEFAVMVSATPGAPDGVPYVSPALRTETYVWSMPVTTDPARAFGEEIWGYPKSVAEIDIETDNGVTRTGLTVDDQRVLSLAVERPPARSRELSLSSYTLRDGALCRTELTLAGELGGRPLSSRVDWAFGAHPWGRRLASLEIGSRPLARFGGDCEFMIGAPQALDAE